MDVTFTIPRADLDDYASLPDKAKADVQLLLETLRAIHGAPSQKEGCEAAANRLQGVRGMSASSLKRHYRHYRTKGWRALVNGSLLGSAKHRTTLATIEPKRGRLPAEFIEHWRARGEANARKWAPAHRALIRDWRAGVSIPGYGTWQEHYLREHPCKTLPLTCPPEIPSGWAYSNLMSYVSTKVEQAAARKGVAAAMEHLPTLSLDVSGLQPLQVIVFDDVRTDFLVHVPEVGQICELWGLVAMDLATRRIIRFGLRPRIRRDDGSKESILRRDMQALVCGILRNEGYPKADHGLTLVVENASAAITPAFQAALHQATQGKVKVQRTSMIIGQVFADGFADGNRGNYKGKAWLESYFNLLHNELASLPGQTGASYQLKPAELEGRRKEAQALLKKGAYLPPALRMELRLPFLSLTEARIAIEDTFRRIDSRTQHRLKGFDNITEWRLPQVTGAEWSPWEDLPTLPAELIPTVETRERKESPLERFHRLHNPEHYHRLPESALPGLYMEHKLITYTGPKQFGFQLGKQTYSFWRPQLETELKEGHQYLAWFDSSNLDRIHLTDKDGRYLDTIPTRKGIAWGDREELAREIAIKKRTLNDTLQRVQERHFDGQRHQDRIEDISHNTRLLEQATTPRDESEASGTQAIRPRPAKPKTDVDIAAEILRQERRPLAPTKPQPEQLETYEF